MYIISHFQAKEILDGYTLEKKEIECSLDLGISRSKIICENNDFLLPDGQRIMVKLFTKILGDQKVCYLLQDNEAKKIQLFSEETNKFYKLFPTGKDTPPTIEISGIRMHVIKSINPKENAKRMVQELAPVQGVVLDTCRGLGYTIIQALESGAKRIISFEIDPIVTEVARYNPYSNRLFEDKDVQMIDGDAKVKIKKLEDQSVDRIMHDPPTLALAGQLYSKEFYKELFRVLKKGGILYHYTGNPGSKTRGQDIPKNVMERLRMAGFRDARKAHFGIRAIR